MFGQTVTFGILPEEMSLFFEWGLLNSLTNILKFFVHVVPPPVIVYGYTPLRTLLMAMMRVNIGDMWMLYHAAALVVHIVGVMAVYRLGLRFLQDSRRAFFAGLLFAVHPLHVGAVGSIAGSFDLIGMTMMMWALERYVVYRRDGVRSARVMMYVLSAAAMLISEATLMFPLILLVYELYHPYPHRRLRDVVYFGLIAVVYLALRQTLAVAPALPVVSWPGSLVMVIEGVWMFLGMISSMYMTPSLVYIWFVIFLFLAVMAYLNRRGVHREEAYMLSNSFVWMTIGLLPVLVCVRWPVYLYSRYLYFACFAWSLFVVLVVFKKVPEGECAIKADGIVSIVGVSLVIGLYSVAAVYNLGFFKNSVAFYEQLVRLNPLRTDFHLTLGGQYLRQGQFDRAIAQYQTASKINPSDPAIYFAMEPAYRNQERWTEAEAALQTAIGLRPDFAEAHYNLAVLYAYLGNEPGVSRHLGEATRLWTAQGKVVEAAEAEDAVAGFMIEIQKERERQRASD